MSKSNQNEPTSASESSGAIPDKSEPADINQSEAPATTSYWRLKLATANKLGKRSEGSRQPTANVIDNFEPNLTENSARHPWQHCTRTRVRPARSFPSVVLSAFLQIWILVRVRR